MHDVNPQDMQEAGTGFMEQPAEALAELQRRGYTTNLVLCYDHLEAQGARIRPSELVVDEIHRFENTSDPDDQSILYVISSESHGLKGTCLESYGLYHEEMSPELLRRLSRRAA